MRWFAALLFLPAACTQAPAPPVPAAHPTIVSLNPCTDAILAEVADPGQLLAISNYSHDPASSSLPQDIARRFPATGGTVEEVVALDPDLVVAGSFLPPATRNAFARLGMRVETLGIASTIADSEAQIRRLAALAQHKERGEALIGRIEKAWADSASTAPPVSTLFWQDGGIVPGPESLIAELMAHTGLASQSASRGMGQGAYIPLERVLADPPALIVAASDERMLTHPVLRHLQDTQHANFDPALLYCAGPSIPPALDRLREIRRAVSPLPLAGGVGGGRAKRSASSPTPQPPPASGRGRP